MKRPGALAVEPGRPLVRGVGDRARPTRRTSGRSDLWIVASDGSVAAAAAHLRHAARRATRPSARTRTRIAFTAKRDEDEAAQVYVLDLAGGEAQRVTNWPGGARVAALQPGRPLDPVRGPDLPRRRHRGGQPQGRRATQGAQVQRARLRQLPDPPLGSLARRAASLAAGAAARRRVAGARPARRHGAAQASAATAAGSATRATRSRRPGRRTAAAWCSRRRPTATRPRAPR